MTPPFRSSAPCQHVLPKPHTDACQRFQKHGPIQPMEQPRSWTEIALWCAFFILITVGAISLPWWIQ